MFLIVQGALAAADPHIEEAARMAGATRARILRTITLPLVFPAIAAAMLIVFIKAIGDFGVPSILGGEFQVLPTLIYYQIHGFFNLNAASAIAAVNVLLTLRRDAGARVGQPQAQLRDGRRHRRAPPARHASPARAPSATSTAGSSSSSRSCRSS